MRPLTTALSLVLACGPTVPSSDDDPTTTGAAETTAVPGPTTTAPDPTIPATTTTSATTTPAADSTTSDGDFIVRTDTLIIEDCDIFAQDCPRGHKCAPWANDGGSTWNATHCVEITGDGAPGEPCTAPDGPLDGHDDCALGGFCWDVDERNHGTCLALCGDSPDAPNCPPESACNITSDGVLSLCLPTCDPLAPDCPDGEVCVPNNDTFFCILDAAPDTGQTNDPCEFINTCDNGLVCLSTSVASSACDPNFSGCCQPFCKFPDSPCPNPDQQCRQWFEPPIPPGFEDIGACAIPE